MAAGNRGGGRPAKPTKLKVLHGDQKSRINNAEPKAPEVEVTAPDDLSDEARAVWDRLAPSLITAGVLTVWDIDAFVMVCNALVIYRKASKLVAGSAVLVNGSTGLTVNPAIKAMKEAEQTFATFGARFGLTPSDRSKIKVETSGGNPSETKDPSRLLS